MQGYIASQCWPRAEARRLSAGALPRSHTDNSKGSAPTFNLDHPTRTSSLSSNRVFLPVLSSTTPSTLAVSLPPPSFPAAFSLERELSLLHSSESSVAVQSKRSTQPVPPGPLLPLLSKSWSLSPGGYRHPFPDPPPSLHMPSQVNRQAEDKGDDITARYDNEPLRQRSKWATQVLLGSGACRDAPACAPRLRLINAPADRFHHVTNRTVEA